MKKIFIAFMGVLTFSSISSTNALSFGLGNTGGNKTPTVGKNVEEILRDTGGFYIGDTSSKDIYLTFDTGYENGYTNGILDTLKKTGTPAAFFVTGHFLKEEALVKRMAEENHVVGNHTWSHPDMSNISHDKMKEELVKVEEKYKSITGKEIDKFIRPPRGTFSRETLVNLKRLDYTTVFWSLAFVDWHIDKQNGWKYSYDNIMDRIHLGSIILLHTVSKDNADALERVIIDLKDKGYNFKSLYNLVKPEYM